MAKTGIAKRLLHKSITGNKIVLRGGGSFVFVADPSIKMATLASD